ncbi:MAG: tRNA 5-hydroxyuridine modification protein YegQ [Proteobacteria bacterium]|nr:tRNA 5-hydroxyuridine modification protein YegQ [Pseudomonadota bacterium]
MKRPELLSPAGTYRNMRYALAYGADAVYAGQPRYSMRVRENDFDLAQLERGINETHALGKRFYVASNLSPHNSKVKTYMGHMAPVIAMQPDALIMSDPGLIMMVRERWPEVPIHLSVQANVINFATVKFWSQLGIARIILSRELSLDEVEEIRQLCPDIELEVFVHGALCIAYSGRCLLSGYMNHRDANQGACTNSCRWDYKVHEAEQDETGELQPITMASVLLEESKRPGDLMPAHEDEHGTYIMNSKDLRAVQHVARLAAMGIDSLKIEGRTKSHYYAARATQVYRRAIDDAVDGRPFDLKMLRELDGLASRGYTEGFFRRHAPEDYQNYLIGSSKHGRQQLVGEVVEINTEEQNMLIKVNNKFSVGDSMELMTPAGNRDFELRSMLSVDGEPIKIAPGSDTSVRIPLQGGAKEEFTLLLKALD